MNDGNTAATIGPVPTENEMNMFRQMLDRALNAIVQSSELAHRVEEMSAKLTTLDQSLEQARRTNASLDEMLAHVRSQRDAANIELNNIGLRLNEAEAKVQQLTASLQGANERNSMLEKEVVHQREIADSYFGDATKYAEENDKLKAKLAEAADWAASIAELFKKPEPPVGMSGYLHKDDMPQEGPRDPVPTFQPEPSFPAEPSTPSPAVSPTSAETGHGEHGGERIEGGSGGGERQVEPVYHEGQRVGFVDHDTQDQPHEDRDRPYPGPYGKGY